MLVKSKICAIKKIFILSSKHKFFKLKILATSSFNKLDFIKTTFLMCIEITFFTKKINKLSDITGLIGWLGWNKTSF